MKKLLRRITLWILLPSHDDLVQEAKRLHPFEGDKNRDHKLASKRRNFIEGGVFVKKFIQKQINP